MAAFNLNQQQTPSQSCTEISVRAHTNETEREQCSIRTLNSPVLGSDLYVFKVKITQETMSSTVCAHHSQTSEEYNRVQHSLFATFAQGFLQTVLESTIFMKMYNCPYDY